MTYIPVNTLSQAISTFCLDSCNNLLTGPLFLPWSLFSVNSQTKSQSEPFTMGIRMCHSSVQNFPTGSHITQNKSRNLYSRPEALMQYNCDLSLSPCIISLQSSAFGPCSFCSSTMASEMFFGIWILEVPPTQGLYTHSFLHLEFFSHNYFCSLLSPR